MDTDRCIQKLVRTEPESSEHTQHKIEETIQYWAAQEKKGSDVVLRDELLPHIGTEKFSIQ